MHMNKTYAGRPGSSLVATRGFKSCMRCFDYDVFVFLAVLEHAHVIVLLLTHYRNVTALVLGQYASRGGNCTPSVTDSTPASFSFFARSLICFLYFLHFSDKASNFSCRSRFSDVNRVISCCINASVCVWGLFVKFTESSFYYTFISKNNAFTIQKMIIVS